MIERLGTVHSDTLRRPPSLDHLNPHTRAPIRATSRVGYLTVASPDVEPHHAARQVRNCSNAPFPNRGLAANCFHRYSFAFAHHVHGMLVHFAVFKSRMLFVVGPFGLRRQGFLVLFNSWVRARRRWPTRRSRCRARRTSCASPRKPRCWCTSRRAVSWVCHTALARATRDETP